MNTAEDAGHNPESIIIAVLPKIPALVSIVCSSVIVRKVYKSPKKRKNVYHRILCGLSCCDIISSSVYFLGTWLIPAEKVGGFGLVFGASGNHATCALSGFLTQFAVSSPLYNGTLAWYYLVSIYYSWSDRKIRKIENYFHIIPVGFALVSSSIALGFDMYGNVEWLCWINPDVPDDKVPSIAQEHFRIFQWVCLFGPVWVTIVFVTTVMYMLYKKMRENEKKMEKYKFSMTLDGNVDEKRSSGKKRKQWRRMMGESMEKNSSSALSTDSLKYSLQSSLSNSHTHQGDGWKQLRNLTQKDNKGSKKLRHSDTPVVVSLPDEDVGSDADAKCYNVPSTAANADIMDEATSDSQKKSSQSCASEDTEVDVEAQSNDVSSTTADAFTRTEAKSDCHNEASSIVESKNAVLPTFLDAKPTIDEEDAMKYNSEDFPDGDDKDPKLSFAETLENAEKPISVSTHRKESVRNVSFLEASSAPSLGDGKKKRVLKFAHSMKQWSFLSRVSKMSSFNDQSSFGLSISALDEKKKLYNNASNSRQIAIQGMLYVCAFYITWLFPTLQRITELSVSKNYFVLQFFDTFLLPLQGALNFGIYIRPRMMKFRKDNPELGFWKSLWKVSYETD